MQLRLNKSKLNLTAGVLVVILSLFTIYWHHQMFLLFKQSQKIEAQMQKLVALNKQLLTDRSEIVSGMKIKQNAIDVLNMRMPYKKEYRDITL